MQTNGAYEGTVLGSDRLPETLLARLALTLGRPLGGLPAQPALDLIIGALKRRHPGIFERLADFGDAQVLIDPVDMPAALVLRFGQAPRLRLRERTAAAGADDIDATIRGRFPALLNLLEGRIDGDALFFTRDLSIEGDTELVVALRNAVDGEDIDLAADIAAALGPAGRLVGPLRRLAGGAMAWAEQMHQELLRPASRRLEGLERRLSRLEEGKR